MKFEKLVDVLEADSEEGIVDAAVDKINALNDSVAEKDKKIDALEKKLADEDTDAGDGDGEGDKDKGKEGEEDKDKGKEGEEDKDKDKGNGEGEEAEDAKALKEKNEKLEKENEELKKEKAAHADSVKRLTDTVEKLSKRTDAIGAKQVKPLYHDSDDVIDELKKARGNIYADARKVR